MSKRDAEKFFAEQKRLQERAQDRRSAKKVEAELRRHNRAMEAAARAGDRDNGDQGSSSAFGCLKGLVQLIALAAIILIAINLFSRGSPQPESIVENEVSVAPPFSENASSNFQDPERPPAAKVRQYPRCSKTVVDQCQQD